LNMAGSLIFLRKVQFEKGTVNYESNRIILANLVLEELKMRKLIILLVTLGVLLLTGCSFRENAKLIELDKKYNQGQYEIVVEEANKFVSDNPDSYRGWNILGWAYLKLDNYKKAEECFDRSIAINPNYDNAYVGKGVLCREDGDFAAAREWYLKAIAITPQNPEAFSSLLVIELKEGNDAKAVEYGEKAWTLRKDSPVIAANLAIAYHYIGDVKKRDEFYEHAKRLGYLNLQTLKEIFEGKLSLR